MKTPRSLTLPRVAALLAAMTATLAPLSHAATLYWDTNGDTAGVGGAGTWANGSGNWSTSAAGDIPTSNWTNTNLDVADFQGTAGAVAVDAGGVTASQVLFNSAGYSLTGGALTITPAASTATVIDFQAGTGSTTIGNTISIQHDASVATSANFTFKNSTAGTLTLGGNIDVAYTTGTPSGTKTITFNNSNAGGAIYVNGIVGAGPGASTTKLSFTGPGTTYLNGANANDGGSAIDNGTIMLGNNSALGSGGLAAGTSSTGNTMAILTNAAVTIANAIETKGAGSSRHTIGGATAVISTFSGQIKFSTSGADIKVVAADGGRVNFTGQLQIGKRLSKEGAGIVAFSANNNTGTAGVSVTEGTLLLMNASGSATGTGTVSVLDGAVLGGTGITTSVVTAMGSSSTFSAGDMGLSAIGTLRLNGGLTAASGATFDFDVNGASVDVIDFGTGTLSLAGTQTINLTSLGTVQTGSAYTLFSGTGDWSASVGATFLFNGPAGYVLDTSYGSGTGYVFDTDSTGGVSLSVQLVAIPEPSTYSLLAGAGGLMLVLRRRRTGRDIA